MTIVVHGESFAMERTPEYVAWINMISRCNNENLKEYPRYGGRGIKVCDRWRNSFPNFLEDVGRRPSPGHSLDRYPDTNGNYEPGNVRWATDVEQARNMRSNRKIEWRGRTLCLQEMAEETGLPRTLIAQRLDAGMSPEDAVSKPVGPTLHEWRGQALSLRAIALMEQVPHNSLIRRVNRHGEWKKNCQGKKPRKAS